MDALISSLIGVMFGCAVYLVLSRRSFSVIMGLTLAAYGTNLFLLATGRMGNLSPPIITEGVLEYADPLPQALVLTAIVIGFGMTAFLIVLSLRTSFATDTDHVDGVDRGDVRRLEKEDGDSLYRGDTRSLGRRAPKGRAPSADPKKEQT